MASESGLCCDFHYWAITADGNLNIGQIPRPFAREKMMSLRTLTRFRAHPPKAKMSDFIKSLCDDFKIGQLQVSLLSK